MIQAQLMLTSARRLIENSGFNLCLDIKIAGEEKNSIKMHFFSLVN